jgi:hypothetical protein
MNSLRYALVALLIVAVVGAIFCRRFIAGYLKYGQQARQGTLAVGDPAPNLTLVDLDGATRRSLQEYLDGKPLVLVFGSFT